MYSLVAIGFVLIYKASGVFNFAQGSMVLFAALTFVTLTEQGLPFWAAFPITVAGHDRRRGADRAAGAAAAGQSQTRLTLFMATLGLSFVIEGLAQVLMGADVHQLDLGIDDMPLDLWRRCRSVSSISSPPAIAIVAGGRAGRSSSARREWASRCAPWPTTRWRRNRSASGCRASGASSGASRASSRWSPALLWGARQGVQFSLSLVVLKALPVLIIGGFSSIPGAIVGGLLVGATENLADIYVGPLVNGSVSTWFAYILAVAFLLVRPSGLFGDPAIERV